MMLLVRLPVAADGIWVADGAFDITVRVWLVLCPPGVYVAETV